MTGFYPVIARRVPPLGRALFGARFLKMFVFVLASIVGTAASETTEIIFDHGGEQDSTVIGLYRPEGLKYILATDFSIMAPETLLSATVRLRAHVGANIRPVFPDLMPRICVRVNGGEWYWKSLAPYQNGRHQWIEVDIPASEWKLGLNRLEVSSNVSNEANRTSKTVDLLACTTPPILNRSSYSINDGETYSLLGDRNWNVRLLLNEKPGTSGRAVRLELDLAPGQDTVKGSVQYVLRAHDKNGVPVSTANASWSATGGRIDSWGLFHPAAGKSAKVVATLDGLKAEHVSYSSLQLPAGVEPPDSPRRLRPISPEGHLSLSGKWGFSLDPNDVGEKEGWYRPEAEVEWGSIVVPGTWQAQGFGLDYHGVGWYHRTIETPGGWEGKNVWAQFHGASTKATVWLNGGYVGEHLGNWAPFTLGLAKHWNGNGDNVLVVRVEEILNHFSAGFPREIGRMGGTDSHFGGLWQNVTLFATGPLQIDDLYAVPKLAGEEVRVRATLRVENAIPPAARVVVAIEDPSGRRIVEREEGIPPKVASGESWMALEELDLAAAIPSPRVWSPDSPSLYTAILEVYDGDTLSHRRSTRFGMRGMERDGTKILLNGEPLMVRGILHWGYYPDLFNIDPSEDRIRQEFKDLRASGFNLVKVCLFTFPRRFYEIADETGMLLWQEYPTWLYVDFPQMGDTSMDADFEREYPEWFRYDRGFTSVILRDLTCEADINPNFDLLERIYHIGKDMLDGALLCDNSAFFKHRITDWYVCHTYRDLNDYYEYLAELVGKMRAAPEVKPFLFGEDFDADTYRDTEAIENRFMRGETPWWLANGNFEGQARFDEELRKTLGPDAPKRLVAMQKKHSFALRKAYIEEFRHYPEPAGFVMTSLRDISVTRPGFYDDLGELKWSPDEWKSFNADRVLLFQTTERRSRCFAADEPVTGTIEFSNYGSDVENAPLKWNLSTGGKSIGSGEMAVSAKRGEIVPVSQINVAIPEPYASTATPLVFTLDTEIGEDGALARNEWKVWVFPVAENAAAASSAAIYAYCPDGPEAFADKYPGLGMIPVRPSGGLDNSWIRISTGNAVNLLADNTVLITSIVDEQVRGSVEAGVRAVHLASSHGDDAFIGRQNAPFWRETAIWLPSDSGLGDFPHEGFVDVQFLDLTQGRPFSRSESGSDSEPIVWGVSARHPGAGAFDYVVRTPLGSGSVLSSCLVLSGDTNVAGRHLLRCLVDRAIALSQT